MKKSFIFLFMVFVAIMNGEATYKVKDVAEGDVYVLPAKPEDTLRSNDLEIS